MLAIMVLMACVAAGFFWPGALWAGCFFTFQVAAITDHDAVSMIYMVLAVGVAGFHALRRPPALAFGMLDAVFLFFIVCFCLTVSYMPSANDAKGAAGSLLLSVVTMFLLGRLTCWPDRLTQTTRELLVTVMVVGTILAVIIFKSRVRTVVRVARLSVGNASDVGISGPFPFVLVAAIAGIFFYFNRRQWVLAILSVVTLALVGYISVYSATRGVYVAAIGGLGVLYLAGRKRIKLQAAITMGMAGIFGLVAAIPFMPKSMELQNAVDRLFGNLRGGGVVLDPAALERLNNYHMAIALFMQHPYFGTGIGGFTFFTGINYVHNIFLEVACDFGLVGVGLLCIYLANLYISGFRLARLNPEAGSVLIGFTSIQLAHMLVSETLSHAKPLFLFTAIIAGALATLEADQKSEARLALSAARAQHA